METFNAKAARAAAEIYMKLNKKAESSRRAELPEGFTVTCHAGAMFTPPNSVYSVKTAVGWGAKVVEFDVSFRPDGSPVIIHAATPGNSDGVPLESALEAVAESPDCKINLDLKSTANLAAVDELVKLNGLCERVFYTGVSREWVEAVRNSSEIPYYLNYEITAEDASDKESARLAAESAKSLGAIGINSNFRGASSLFVEAAHESGLLVSLWTVNSPKDMIRVLKMKPDNITTKRPNILMKMIEG